MIIKIYTDRKRLNLKGSLASTHILQLSNHGIRLSCDINPASELKLDHSQQIVVEDE